MSKLPSDPMVERAVLGAALLRDVNAELVLSTCTPESFYVTAHREIFDAMTHLRDDNRDIELIVVMSHLEQSGRLQQAGGYDLLEQCQREAATAVKLDEHLGILRDLKARRECIVIGSTLVSEGHSVVDPSKTIGKAQQSLDEAVMGTRSALLVPVSETAMATFQVYKERAEKVAAGHAPAWPHKLPFLRHKVPMLPKKYIVLAASPKTGKTRLACLTALCGAIKGYPVYFACQDTDRDSIELWLSCMLMQIDSEPFEKGDSAALEGMERLEKGFKYLSELPICIDATASQDPRHIFAMARKYYRGFNPNDPRLVIIDHIGQCKAPESIEGEYAVKSWVSEQIRIGIRETDCSSIVISQLNRNSRNEKRKPGMHDFRGSGKIEQDIDAAVFMHKDNERPDAIQIYAEGRYIVGNPYAELFHSQPHGHHMERTHHGNY
jgi:replicative DNA helicase